MKLAVKEQRLKIATQEGEVGDGEEGEDDDEKGEDGCQHDVAGSTRKYPCIFSIDVKLQADKLLYFS